VALDALSLVLALVLGLAIHRGGVCMVRGTAEVLSTGRAHMMVSFAKAIAWVLVITIPMLWLVPSARFGPGWAFSGYALLGGLVFGLGAAINRGCAFATLGRLGNGEAGAVVTLLGFALGSMAYAGGATSVAALRPERHAPTYDAHDPLVVVVFVGLAAWAAVELWRLWRTRPVGGAWRQTIVAHPYRLSTVVALIGIANGILFALHGPWAYTRTFRDAAQQVAEPGAGPADLQWALFLAVVAGAVVSAWQSGTLRPDWRPSAAWLQSLAGGLLMGLGAGLTPGGNDVLVLHGIPQLSAHALPAYLAMTAGIAMVLIVMRAATGGYPEVDCRGDVCRTRWIAGRRGARGDAAKPAAGARGPALQR